jgi:hypothetical protein
MSSKKVSSWMYEVLPQEGEENVRIEGLKLENITTELRGMVG